MGDFLTLPWFLPAKKVVKELCYSSWNLNQKWPKGKKLMTQ